MRVSEQVGQWIEQALAKHLDADEDCCYDATMAPTGGGANGDTPYLACLLSMRSPVPNQTLNMSRFFPNYVVLTDTEIEDWVRTSLKELRDARRHAQFSADQVKGNGSGPGRLFLPGGGK